MRATNTVLLVLLGCGSASAPPTTLPPTSEPPASAAAEPVTADPFEEPPARVARPVREPAGPSVHALMKSPWVGPAPTLEIRRPTQDQLIRRGDVMVDLRVADFELRPSPGNHVHVMVDNREHMGVHDISRPFSLSDLYQEKFGEALPEGTHVLRAFLSRPNHEGLKTPTAFAMVVFHVRARTPGFALDARAPLLTYGRPQGCASDASRLLDFHLTNINDLSRTGYRVRYEIDETHRGELIDWTPYRIDDLSDDDHTVRLTLLAPDGTPVPGPFNDTVRTIQSESSCPSIGLIPDAQADEDDESL